MNLYHQILIFGEVLFDCFPEGEEILGGAPFNVAWHLQALGAAPLLISRIGDDDRGQRILAAMNRWGLGTDGVEQDRDHPTGTVEVTLSDGQPSYEIREGVAYDYISCDPPPVTTGRQLLYHGTLALRHETSRQALERLMRQSDCDLFVDVNLRPPWWQQQQVLGWLRQARWAKMNSAELLALGAIGSSIEAAMMELLQRCHLEQLIVTCGSDGALVASSSGELLRAAARVPQSFVDSVGAGDAFSAVYLQGLLKGRSIADNVSLAQQLAARVIGRRGGITDDLQLYQGFSTTG